MTDNLKYCAPHKKNNKFTCFSYNSLLDIKNKWNKKNTKDPIETTNDKKKLWKEVRNKLLPDSPCKYDHCMMETDFMKELNNDEIKYDTFLHKKPIEWNDNPTAWLSTIDIRNVMLQYESKNKNFEFIGPVPIDFDTKKFGSCISDELCNIDLKKLLQNGKDKIGVVFNLDKHNMNGSHWVSLFVELDNGGIYFIDSVGHEPKSEIKNLMKRIKKQGNKLLSENVINSDFFSRKHQYSCDVKKTKDNYILLCNKNISKKYEGMLLEYYDKKINKTVNRVISKIQDNKIYLDKPISDNIKKVNIYGFINFYNKINHQQKNSECGTYSMYFLSELLGGSDFNKVTKNIKRDDIMNSYRDSKFYRPNKYT